MHLTACVSRHCLNLSAAVLVMMTGLGMLTGSTIAVSGSGACMDNLICSAARVSPGKRRESC
jgi:hypothetical protein